MMDTFFILLIFCSLVSGQNLTKPKDWPCPLAEEITPCTCDEYYGPRKITIYCNNVIDIKEIERVFSVDFPFKNLESESKSRPDWYFSPSFLPGAKY